MSNSQAAYAKYYVNSPQFEPIARDAKLDKVREVSENMVPTKVINKYNVKDMLNKKNLKSFRGTFVFREPTQIYNEIISDCRGALVSNAQLMAKVNLYYTDKFEDNLRALYDYSPKFFRDSFYKDVEDSYGQKKPVIDQASFALYEKYIYISCLIYYVNQNKEKLRGEIETNAEQIINWAQIRNNDALIFFIEGPKSNYDNPTNFKNQYEMMVSSANSISQLTNQNQLAKMDLTYSEITNFKHEVNVRPNSYHKEMDEARQYFVIVRDEKTLTAEIDDMNNLVFDASHIDIGDITNQNTNGNYNTIKVEQNKYLNPPSQITFRALQQLFNRYNAIRIQELSFNYGVYKTDLSKYTEVYLVFPGINTIEHTIYGSTPRGMLMISGKFIDNKERRRYEFITNEPLLTFDGSQTNVTSFKFYITTNYKEKNSIEPNNLFITFSKADVYNHLLSTGRKESDINKDYVLKVPSRSIYFDIPDDLSSVYESDLNTLIKFVLSLDFVPDYIKVYYKNLPKTYEKCINLKKSIMKVIVDTPIDEITMKQARDSGIEDDLIAYNRIQQLFASITALLIKINTLHQWQDASPENYNVSELSEQLSHLSTDTNWINNVSAAASTITDYESVRSLLRLICSFDINTVLDIQGLTSYNDEIEYVNVIDSAVSLITNTLSFNTVDITLHIDLWSGTINGFLFHYDTSKNQLHFVYSERDSDNEYHYIPYDENNVALIRFFDEHCNLINNSAYFYDNRKMVDADENEGIVQKSIMKMNSPMEVAATNIYNTGTAIKIKRDKDIKGYNVLVGGDIDFSMEASALSSIMNNECYANITDFTNIYQEADFWADNAELRMKFVKYIDERLLKLNALDIELFRSEHDHIWSENGKNYTDVITIVVTKDKQLNVGINRHVDIEADGNINSSSYDEYIDLIALYGYEFVYEKMFVTSSVSKVTITYDPNRFIHFEYIFYFDTKSVTRFEIVSFNNGINDYREINTLVTLSPYMTSTSLNYSDIATRYITAHELDMDKWISAYTDNNLFRAYYSKSKLLSYFWLNDAYITSILINPITDVPKSKEYSGTVTHIAGNMTVIYSVKDHLKTFYNLLVINKYEDDWLMLVDDNLVNDEIYVYENDLREYQSTNIVTSLSDDFVEMDLVDHDGRILNMKIYIDHIHKSVYKIRLTNPETVMNVDINGNFNSGISYCFSSSSLSVNFKSLGNIGLNFTFSDELVEDKYPFHLTSAYVTLSTSHLYKYTIEGNRPYRYTMLNYYYNIYSTPVQLRNEGLISIRNTNALSYNRILPMFKYYQNNIESDLYANDKFKMVIDKDEHLINNTMISMRTHKLVTSMNTQELSIANSIPYTDRYLIENINGKMVVNSIDNSKINDNIMMKYDSGIIDSTDNNAIYLAMNMK